MVIGLAAMIAGCSKADQAQPDAAIAEQLGSPKADHVFVKMLPNINGTFQVLNPCPYGTLQSTPSPFTQVGSFQPGTMNLVIPEGTCLTDANNLILVNGSTAGTSGPVYYIKPNSSGWTYPKILKLRVKNVSGATYDGYNRYFVYDSTTNTWSWDGTATTYYELSVVSAVDNGGRPC